MISNVIEIKLKIFQPDFFSLKVEEFHFKEKSFNLNQLEMEFFSFYQIVYSNIYFWKTNRSDELFYIDFLCHLLIRYYEYNKVREKLEEFKEYQYKIKLFRKPIPSNNSKTSFYLFLLDRIVENTWGCIFSFKSVSKIRDYISNVNTKRLYWYYCHDMVTWILIFAQKNCTIKAKQIDDFLKILNKPNPILCVLSVALYAMRFTVDLITITKHVIKAYLGNELSSEFVLTQELERLGLGMLNDLVWGTVNLFTNYNALFHISDPAANNIFLVFLVFDAVLLIANLLLEAIKYQHRVRELEEQKNKLVCEIKLLDIVNRQHEVLKDQWENQKAYYVYLIVAACCLAIGLGGCFFFPAEFLFYTAISLKIIGSILYATADEYKKYKESMTLVHRELSNSKIEANPELLQKLRTERKKAYFNFCKEFIFSSIGPVFFIVTMAIYWPAALLLAVLYLSYRLANDYRAHKSQAAEEPEKNSPGVYRLFHRLPNKEELKIPLFNQYPNSLALE